MSIPTESQALIPIATHDYDVGKLICGQVKNVTVDSAKPGDLSLPAIDQFAYLANM